MDGQDRRALIDAFDACLYPRGSLNLDEAWLGIYQMLMWYSDVAMGTSAAVRPDMLLHVDEVSALRRPPGRRRAELAEARLAAELGVSKAAVPDLVDRMLKLDRWRGMQRNNPLGNGLRTLFHEILTKYGNPSLDYLEEQDASKWFSGITMPGRSRTPKIDILVARGNVPRAVVSCKWSIRHDRISDPTNECISYRQAAIWHSLNEFDYWVISNEYSEARLEKVRNQPCVNGLIHVHAPMLQEVANPAHTMWAASGRLIDMVEFVKLTYSW